ncbi:hypothetical protein CMI37_38265 [Candidatus Pacearchaeota archaeon]|nr:hypothetical protein [Candidatus Pacearchaeota archaeon]
MPSAKRRPAGVHAEDRKLDRCPMTSITPAEWRTVSVWSAWRRLGGMPGPGSVQDQEAKLVESLGVLDFEQDLIQAYAAEVSERRQSNG